MTWKGSTKSNNNRNCLNCEVQPLKLQAIKLLSHPINPRRISSKRLIYMSQFYFPWENKILIPETGFKAITLAHFSIFNINSGLNIFLNQPLLFMILVYRRIIKLNIFGTLFPSAIYSTFALAEAN